MGGAGALSGRGSSGGQDDPRQGSDRGISEVEGNVQRAFDAEILGAWRVGDVTTAVAGTKLPVPPSGMIWKPFDVSAGRFILASEVPTATLTAA